jgi:DNA-binding response OmpR family regulator
MAQHILIVEDDEMVQSFLAMHLKNDGFEVSSAGSGKEMSRALGQADIDLIILDLGLPDGDGLTLAQEVRSRSSIPIIVATARQGADDYVTKPYDPRELVLRIRNIFSHAKTGVAAASPGGTGVPPAGGERHSAVLLGEPSPGRGRSRHGGDARGDRRRSDVEERRGYRASQALVVSLLALVVAGGAVYWTVMRAAPNSNDTASTPVAEALQEPATTQTSIPEPAPEQPVASAVPTVAAAPPVQAVQKPGLPQAEVNQETVKVVTLNSPEPTPPPEEDTVPKPMAVLLGYSWVLETKCQPIPAVE